MRGFLDRVKIDPEHREEAGIISSISEQRFHKAIDEEKKEYISMCVTIYLSASKQFEQKQSKHEQRLLDFFRERLTVFEGEINKSCVIQVLFFLLGERNFLAKLKDMKRACSKDRSSVDQCMQLLLASQR